MTCVAFQTDGTYTPRIKIYNGREYDIANLTFRKLPPKMQYENLISTKILCDSVVKHRNHKKGEFTHSFTEETARKLHEAWRGRNLKKAKDSAEVAPSPDENAPNKEQDTHIPYKKLSETGILSRRINERPLPTQPPLTPFAYLHSCTRVFRKSEGSELCQARDRYLQ